MSIPVQRVQTTWQETRGPCPVCHHRGWCRISPDGAMIACRRVDSGAIKRLDYADGPAWLHARDRLGARHCLFPLPAGRSHAPRLDDVDLDRVYRSLLACPELRLCREHRAQLRMRGLTDGDLDRDGYCSLPATCRAGVLRRLREQFHDQVLLMTPGVIRRDGPYGPYLTLAGLSGILIPIRSADGRVVGLVIRPDEPADGGKYRWLSSAGDSGPRAVARIHVPDGVELSGRIVIVEGALKANVAHVLSHRAVIGLPGCHVTSEAISVLQARGVEEVLLALDVDALENIHVARAQVEGLRRLKAAGFTGGLVRWDRKLGKGLDDALLTLRRGAI
jgi:hypothetical protein